MWSASNVIMIGFLYFCCLKFRWGITAVINLQHPGEHANCGFGLEKSGFTYNPEDFMDNGGTYVHQQCINLVLVNNKRIEYFAT